MFSKRTLIIAEVGVNHNGSIEKAFKLVDAASSAGADVVKFQTFKADKIATADAPTAPYQQKGSIAAYRQQDILWDLELSDDDHYRIMRHCQDCGVEFLSTAFDIESLNYLVDMDIQRVKVPSGEITNLPYLETVGRLGLPVILSTGMANLVEIDQALKLVVSNGTPLDFITILQCTTSYPTPVDQINLNALKTIADTFGCRIGFSDHSLGSVAAIGAIALGAEVIEKHITLDQSLPGPDHAASLPVEELEDFVRGIRFMEAALGDGVKRASELEMENIVVARKSIVADRNIEKGEIFTAENLTVKRPANGLSPMNWHHVIGQKASRDLQKDEILQSNDIS